MTDVIILGSGPAGVSASLYAARAGLTACIIHKDDGALDKAEKIENYYGFAQPISGRELAQAGVAQAQRLDVKLIAEEVTSIQMGDVWTVQTSQNTYQAHSVILSTGSARKTPRIPGIRELEGKGVSYCATCDAFFYRNKPIAVLGSGEYALHEAQELLPIVAQVTVLTNGETPQAVFPDAIKVIRTPIAALQGENRLREVRFQDDSTLEVSGLFVAQGVAGSTDLARTLGAIIEGNRIVVDENMATNIPGLFAAGDCTGGMLQIAKAVYQGAVAGTQAVKYVRGKG